MGCITRAYGGGSLDEVPPELGEEVYGYSVVTLLPGDFGFVCQRARTLLAVIRGTILPPESVDLFHDLSCDRIPYNSNSLSGGIHSGFLGKYDVIRKELQRTYAQMNQGKADRLVIAGHSLGGAMASIGYVNLSSMAALNRHSVRIDCLAIATPGVFDEELTRSFQTTVGNRLGELVTFNHNDDEIANAGYRLWNPAIGAALAAPGEILPLPSYITPREYPWKAHPIGIFEDRFSSDGYIPGDSKFTPRHSLETYQNTFLRECFIKTHS